MNARHSKKDPNWTTPSWLVEAIRELHGGKIDLDPFASLISNRTVRAEKIWTKEDDGFSKPWVSEAMLVNPPGGLIKKAWRKLCEEYLKSNLKRAAWIGFSVEQLCVLADPANGIPEDEHFYYGRYHPTDFSWVLLRKRISFVKEDGSEGSPSHSNYLTFPGVPHADVSRLFGPYGRVLRGPLSVDGNPPEPPGV